jgi:hypothetical protein
MQDQICAAAALRDGSLPIPRRPNSRSIAATCESIFLVMGLLFCYQWADGGYVLIYQYPAGNTAIANSVRLKAVTAWSQ